MLRLAVEIYADLPGYRVEPVHYAWALFPAPQQGPRQLDLDLAAPAASLDGAPLPIQVGDLRDGSYFAALWVYQGEQVRKAIPFLRFERRGGAVSAVTPLDVNAGFVALDPPAQPLAITIGDGIGLRGYELSAGVARPGERAWLSLLWQAERAQPQLYLVFAQVLDDADRKIAQWDGAVGGDWWPTPVWRAGQRVWQDVPLTVAANAPPGRYRVIVGVYDPATGRRLPLADGSDALLLTHLEVQP